MKFGYTITGFEGVENLVNGHSFFSKTDAECIQARLEAEEYEIAMFESLDEVKKLDIETTMIADYASGLEAEGGSVVDKVTNPVAPEKKAWYKRLWEKIKAMFKAVGQFFMSFFRWIGRKLGIIKEGLRSRFVIFIAKHTWAKKAINFILRKKQSQPTDVNGHDLANEFSDENIADAVNQTEEEEMKEIQSSHAGFESEEITGFEGMNIWKSISGFFKKLKQNVIEYVKYLVHRFTEPEDLRRASGAFRLAKIEYTANGEKSLSVDILDVIKRKSSLGAFTNTESGGSIAFVLTALRNYTGLYLSMVNEGSEADKLFQSVDFNKNGDNEAAIEQVLSSARNATKIQDESMFKISYIAVGHNTVYECYKDTNFEYIQRFLETFNSAVSEMSKNFESQYNYFKGILDREDATQSDFLKGFLTNRPDEVRLEKARESLSLLREMGLKVSTLSKKLLAAAAQIESYISQQDRDKPEVTPIAAVEM